MARMEPGTAGQGLEFSHPGRAQPRSRALCAAGKWLSQERGSMCSRCLLWKWPPAAPDTTGCQQHRELRLEPAGEEKKGAEKFLLHGEKKEFGMVGNQNAPGLHGTDGCKSALVNHCPLKSLFRVIVLLKSLVWVIVHLKSLVWVVVHLKTSQIMG